MAQITLKDAVLLVIKENKGYVDEKLSTDGNVFLLSDLSNVCKRLLQNGGLCSCVISREKLRCQSYLRA